VSSTRLAFIRPLAPSASVHPPKCKDWLHEPKWDGFRFQVIKDGSDVRLHSKSGGEYSSKLPGMRKAFVELPTDSAILDGELCLIDPGGGANFYRLMTQMRTRWPEERLLVFLAFDLLHQDGVDLRSAPLSERKRDLSRHWVKVKCPDWKRDNAERHKLWEGARKPELTEMVPTNRTVS
jgi:bifunctional non-homologous end joining protein LigD